MAICHFRESSDLAMPDTDYVKYTNIKGGRGVKVKW